jgi:hypothetical protein
VVAAIDLQLARAGPSHLTLGDLLLTLQSQVPVRYASMG